MVIIAKESEKLIEYKKLLEEDEIETYGTEEIKELNLEFFINYIYNKEFFLNDSRH